MEDDSFMLEEKRKVSVNYLKSLFADEGKEIPKYVTFINNCEGIHASAENFGLSNEDLHLITDILSTINLDYRHFNVLVECLLPKLLLPEEIIQRMLKLLLTNVWKQSEIQKCNVILQWIASGLQYHIIHKKYLQIYFNVIFQILKQFSLSKTASNVIILIAETEFFAKNHVNIILGMQEKTTKVKTPPHHYSHLLRFIKTFRPDLVPFKVANTSSTAAFSSVGISKFNALMETVKSRVVEADIEQENHFLKLSTLDEESEETMCSIKRINFSDLNSSKPPQKSRLKKKQEVVPLMETLGVNETQQKCKKINISQISSYEELGRNWNNIIIPDNAISLLNSKFGLYVLAFGTKQLQYRFLFSLHEALQNKIILKQYSSKEEVSSLLRLVLRFETFIHQGLSSTSQFLKCFLPFWNGIDYRQLIFKLISWMTFDSYEELNRFCLVPLFSLFISTSTKIKCEIFICLINLFTNLILTLEKVNKNEPALFLPEESIQDWISDSHTVLINIIEFIQRIIIISLLQEPCDIILINAIYDFYEKVQSLEEKYDLNSMTVIPCPLVHQSLLCKTVEPLNRAAKLLLKYRDAASNYDQEKMSKLDVQMKTIESNVRDIYYCISKGQASSTDLFDKSMTKELGAYVDVNQALKHHIMFIPHIHSVREKINQANFDPSAIMQIFCPEILQLVSLCEASNL